MSRYTWGQYVLDVDENAKGLHSGYRASGRRKQVRNWAAFENRFMCDTMKLVCRERWGYKGMSSWTPSTSPLRSQKANKNLWNEKTAIKHQIIPVNWLRCDWLRTPPKQAACGHLAAISWGRSFLAVPWACPLAFALDGRTPCWIGEAVQWSA